jgi:hypothetical protein
MIYSGIGSRQTPDDVLDRMVKIGKSMHKRVLSCAPVVQRVPILHSKMDVIWQREKRKSIMPTVKV